MKKHFTFPSTDRRTKIHAICWTSDSVKPRAVIQLVHGMVEHIERYDEFARFLAEQGFVVVGHDHLGHGRSIVTEEDLGFFAENQPAIVLLQDMHRLRAGISAKYPELPYFMLGHSMGSYLLRRYLATRGEGLAGAIIVGTGQENEAALTAGLAFIKMEAKKYGWRHRSEAVRKLTFGKPYKRFDLTGEDLSNTWLSKNEENVKAYYEDPRCNFLFTLNGYWVLLSTVKFDGVKKNVEAIPKDLPTLIISGEDDPVGNMGKGVKKVYQMFVKAGIQDVSCKLFPGDRHEILNETDREEVYDYVLDWLEMHLPCEACKVPEEMTAGGEEGADAADEKSGAKVEVKAEEKDGSSETEDKAEDKAEAAAEEKAEGKAEAAAEEKVKKNRKRSRRKNAKKVGNDPEDKAEADPDKAEE